MLFTSFPGLLGPGFASPIRNYGANGLCSDLKQPNQLKTRIKQI
jgi:hypothetical protein